MITVQRRKVDDEVPEVEHAVKIQSTNYNTKTKRHGDREVDESSSVDHVVTSAEPFQFEAQLYIFEDSEGVIKMTFKGRKFYNETHVQNPQLRWI